MHIYFVSTTTTVSAPADLFSPPAMHGKFSLSLSLSGGKSIPERRVRTRSQYSRTWIWKTVYTDDKSVIFLCQYSKVARPQNIEVVLSLVLTQWRKTMVFSIFPPFCCIPFPSPASDCEDSSKRKHKEPPWMNGIDQKRERQREADFRVQLT